MVFGVLFKKTKNCCREIRLQSLMKEWEWQHIPMSACLGCAAACNPCANYCFTKYFICFFFFS